MLILDLYRSLWPPNLSVSHKQVAIITQQTFVLITNPGL